MLYTLLPPTERKVLHRDYARRVLVVSLFAVGVAGLIGIGSLFPAFIRAGTEEAASQGELNAVTAKNSSGLSDIQQRVSIGQNLLSVLGSGSNRSRLSYLLESIIQQRQMVRINSIAIDYPATNSAVATIGGIAPTRDALVSFKSRLEASQPMSKVDLPVSELAKGTDVPFSIKITMMLP